MGPHTHFPLFYILFIFTGITFDVTARLRFSLALCALLCGEGALAQAARGASVKGFVINITLCVRAETVPLPASPEAALFRLHCDTSVTLR